jgi:hypothetical protein
MKLEKIAKTSTNGSCTPSPLNLTRMRSAGRRRSVLGQRSNPLSRLGTAAAGLGPLTAGASLRYKVFEQQNWGEGGRTGIVPPASFVPKWEFVSAAYRTIWALTSL